MLNQASWANNATIIAASLFGQSVNGRTCSSANPSFLPTGYRIDHREPRRTSTQTYRQYELLCSSFALSRRSRAWHSLQQRGVCNLETTTF
jgi:hypothetical protein